MNFSEFCLHRSKLEGAFVIGGILNWNLGKREASLLNFNRSKDNQYFFFHFVIFQVIMLKRLLLRIMIYFIYFQISREIPAKTGRMLIEVFDNLVIYSRTLQQGRHNDEEVQQCC